MALHIHTEKDFLTGGCLVANRLSKSGTREKMR